ncbi:MAG: carbohydrate ABC transporter permease [Atopococcus tabaci]|uniref:Carbohydrate ABC transporter permease n=1 Tax=Atopococcus tabaci TaxID=269774 RepID=A0AA43RKS6_9LACT|nr:carbohydrate ABC transporter permease [Atopococcus tabaci]
MGKFKTKRVIYVLAVIVFVFFTLGPIVWAFIISVTPESEQLASTTNLLPSYLYFGNYQELFDQTSSAHKTVFQGILNSLKAAGLTILIGVPLSFITAYAFYRFRFTGRRFLISSLMVTMIIPVFATIVPIYAIFANNGLLDDLKWVAVIYVTAFLPLNTWIMINYFQSLPKELFEAAQVEGANEGRIFIDIVLPLAWPIILTSTLLMFLSSWSQYQIPLILTSSQNTKVVTLVLADFMGRDSINYGMIAASGIITILPPSIIAIIFRKYLISGLSQGSTKG